MVPARSWKKCMTETGEVVDVGAMMVIFCQSRNNKHYLEPGYRDSWWNSPSSQSC